jgi:hypothetical protein
MSSWIKRSALSLAVVLWGTPVYAQHGTDFSGQWVLQSKAPTTLDVPRTLTVKQSIAVANARGEPMQPQFKTITIEREFAAVKRTDTYDIGLVGGFVGGVVGERRDDPNDVPHGFHSVEWVGMQLLFKNAGYSGGSKSSGPYTEHSELWSLERRDRLVITISDESSASPRTTATITYRRRR